MSVVAVGIVVIGLSFGMAIGVCSYAGLFYSPLMSIAPFLLLGLGVDGLFLLLAELDVSDPAKPVPEQVADALVRCRRGVRRRRPRGGTGG